MTFLLVSVVTITICYNKKVQKTGEKTEPFRFLFKVSKPVALTFGFYVNVTVVVFLLKKTIFVRKSKPLHFNTLFSISSMCLLNNSTIKLFQSFDLEASYLAATKQPRRGSSV